MFRKVTDHEINIIAYFEQDRPMTIYFGPYEDTDGVCLLNLVFFYFEIRNYPSPHRASLLDINF